MNKQEQRIIEAARRVLSDWLGGDLTADVSGDFYELESAIKGYEKQSPIDFDWQSFRNQAAKDILCSVILTFEAKESFDKALDNAIDNSIKAADKLISKLKEKEA